MWVKNWFKKGDQNTCLTTHTTPHTHSLADAYGMTAVEAAARGAPSALHWPPSAAADPAAAGVGVTALLRPDRGLAVGVDLSDPEAAASAVAAVLCDGERLKAVSFAAAAAARAHDERAAARQLAEELATACEKQGVGKENTEGGGVVDRLK